jgi:hypothetical protein
MDRHKTPQNDTFSSRLLHAPLPPKRFCPQIYSGSVRRCWQFHPWPISQTAFNAAPGCANRRPKRFYPQIIDGFERVVVSLPAGSRGARYREPPAGWATQDIERRAFLVSLIACLINLRASTSGWCVISELSKGCPTCNDRFRHADFTNSAAQLAKHVAQRPDHEFPFFSLLLQFT